MAQLICELCGSTDLIKDGDVFVCQKCGAKYSVEAAKQMIEAAEAKPPSMSQGPKIDGSGSGIHVAPKPAAGSSHGGTSNMNASVPADIPPAPGPGSPAGGQGELHVDKISDFDLTSLNLGLAGARSVNNYICQGWQLVMEEYNKLENPPKVKIEELATRAKECLLVLDNAAMLDPEDHAQNLLIYNNCLEIIESVKDSHYYETDDEGKPRRKSYPSPFDKFEVAGQKESWEDKKKYHLGILEQAWDDANFDLIQEVTRLEEEAKKVQAELDVLNDERKSKGFFNFSEKREVKDRMAPYEEQLHELNSQIRAIDKQKSDYIDTILKELGSGYTRLDF